MGKHLVNELLFKGHSVTIATRGIMQDNFGDKVTRLIVDRTDANSVKNIIPNLIYDIVFDTIAFASNDVKNLLETVKCKRYVQISSTAVYSDLHNDTVEEEFNPSELELVWCSRYDFAYNEVKRQAECAIVQVYVDTPAVRVRFPFVIGEDDYTKRLYFYVEHIINQKPMFIDNQESQMAFVRSDEAGKFVAFFADNDFTGAINGASDGTISIKEIAKYVESKTGKSLIVDFDGEDAPYNGVEDYYVNTAKSSELGFTFSPLKSWIFKLIDYYIEQVGLS